MDALRGRREPVRPNLDSLFALPSAAITMQIDLGLMPTGVGAVCFRAPEGKAFSELEKRFGIYSTLMADQRCRPLPMNLAMTG